MTRQTRVASGHALPASIRECLSCVRLCRASSPAYSERWGRTDHDLLELLLALPSAPRAVGGTPVRVEGHQQLAAALRPAYLAECCALAAANRLNSASSMLQRELAHAPLRCACGGSAPDTRTAWLTAECCVLRGHNQPSMP